VTKSKAISKKKKRKEGNISDIPKLKKKRKRKNETLTRLQNPGQSPKQQLKRKKGMIVG